MASYSSRSDMPTIGDLRDFDRSSGSWIERFIFNNRTVIMLLCLVATAVLAVYATRLQVNANFERMIPVGNPYIQNYLQYKKELPGLGNSIRIVVENKTGDIYDPAYLETLRKINDALYLVPGVDRSWMKSLWMPIVRWKEITEEGLNGGAVMPSDYNGSPESIAKLRANVARAGITGSLVAADLKSTMIVTPLLDINPATGKPLSYSEFSQALEDKVRSFDSPHVAVHIVGFGKLAGDLIEGLRQVLGFFAASVLIACLFVYLYTRCIRSTLLLMTVSIAGVIWLLGLMQLAGYELDPYSTLVPFLIFAIGLSHGAQKMNGILQDIGRGTHKYVAARYTFRRLFMAGLTALLTNVVGFAVLAIIDIPVIRDLAITTSMGISVLIFTKLILIPVTLSYIGVSPVAARRAVRERDDKATGKVSGIKGRLWRGLDHLTERRYATWAVAGALLLTGVSVVVMRDLKIGDLDAGAPELRPTSRYNLDNAYITGHYDLSSDQFVVIMKTEDEGCRLYPVLQKLDGLSQALRATPGVQTTASLANMVPFVTSSLFEGNGKWMTISRNQDIINTAVSSALVAIPDLTNMKCSVTPLVAYLADHKADTLARVLAVTEQYAAAQDVAAAEPGTAASSASSPVPPVKFLLAAGSAGIEAATNIEVSRGIVTMYLAVYGATALLCLLTFRSVMATVVAMIPLLMTTVICKALMVWLGIGLKVATLPVIAVGVGVGVDYALYLLSVQLLMQRRGETLAVAYRRSLDFTGKVVALVGLTMAAGVITWAWSPIKFQADMGILLAFMFLWNMLGALILIPALSHFLLNPKPTDGKPLNDAAEAARSGAPRPMARSA
ncbi:MAG: MMPL family transporter [Burkholderiaceae bacterium]|nr:MMPL family transporter [Burkholderiaceae bacterium]